MASLIPGYEYDIFISYRQKDNRGDHWVTEFVDALKTELESTFKEEISIYFDINPHDGLLETHDVDASLKEKLKCLIFIPIISRTYCDPKSFAWEHEFKAFVEQASRDQYGLKVKLAKGNVASRILPVRIHDLDVADIKECESVLGGVLRGVEFIYKEAGIDKPLSPGDNEKKNLNNTTHRIQIIKVAHAIKEIIIGIKNKPAQAVDEKEQPNESFKEIREEEKKSELKKPVKVGKVKVLSAIAFVVLLIIAGLIAYPKIFKRDTLEKLRSSGERIAVAVMPFQNMTGDTTKNFWQEMIQNNLINYLSDFSDELKIRPSESVNTLIQRKNFTSYTLITPAIGKTISQILDANVFINGSIQQAGSKLRINATLVDTKTEEILKSFELEGPYKEEMILEITDSLRKKVTDFLRITKLIEDDYPDRQKIMANINSPQAYKYILDGEKAFAKLDYSTAIELYKQAIEADSNFADPLLSITWAYNNRGLDKEAKKWYQKAYVKSNLLSRFGKTDLDLLHAILFGTINDRIKYLREQLDYDNQKPMTYEDLGRTYISLFQYDKAIPEFKKALEIYSHWGVKPFWDAPYLGLGLAYHKTGQYRKEKKLYNKAEQDFPDSPDIIQRQAILALSEGDTAKANGYIEKYLSIKRDNSVPEATFTTNIAIIYSDAGILDKGEEYYRQAQSLESSNPDRLNNLAYFLIDKDRNLSEGLELADKTLALSPDNYDYLHTKGWGLYKMGKYQEAFDLLQKSWDLRREQAIYNHEAFLHLEAAKKAVAGMKNI